MNGVQNTVFRAFVASIGLLLCSLSLSAQSAKNFTISGSVRDVASGEALIGATISIKEMPAVGSMTNAYGYFALTLPAGKHTVRLRYMGYLPQDTVLTVAADQKILFQMKQEGYSTEEVTIEAKAEASENVTSARMGVTKLDVAEVAKIPVLFGEKDILKTIQLLPGVKSAGDGNSGFYVRGGGADQNLVLLDEAPVYNPSHLLGFFSVFNSDALKDVTLIKGGMPAEYGGRLSSVMDVRMKDGNSKKISGTGGIGLISSRLTLEAPIVKDKGSIMVSGRRTYADMFLKLSSDTNTSNSRLYFYDLNLKANYRLGEKDQIFVSGYFGRDNFGFSDIFNFDWGNKTATARWNHLFSSKLFSNTTAIYSNYDYKIKINVGGTNIQINSGIEDYNLKQDFQYYASGKSIFKFGGNIIRHSFIPGVITSDTDTTDITRKVALEGAVYAAHEWSPSNRLKINYGLRLSGFQATGNGTQVYTYSETGVATDSNTYAKGKAYKYYGGWEPRLSASYMLDEHSSLKGSYMRTYQFMHLLSNTTSGTPTDLWIPSSNNVKPQIADQVSLGYFRNFADNGYEFSVESYYKGLQNQIDYKNGAQLNFNDKVEGELRYGVGRAYGIELFVKKKYGKFNGWVSYTLSRTERKIDGINNGEYYAARQDRTHDISIVGIYDVNKRLSVSSTFVYYTGNAVTYPSGKYWVNGQSVSLYSSRNAERMPAYHRLDFGVTLQDKPHKRYSGNWNFSLYNAYGYRNTYSITFQQNEDNPNKTEAVRTTLFRWIPSVAYNFSF